jgi:hypothetical protein
MLLLSFTIAPLNVDDQGLLHKNYCQAPTALCERTGRHRNTHDIASTPVVGKGIVKRDLFGSKTTFFSTFLATRTSLASCIKFFKKG